jgi:hypothetical protein
MGGQHHMDKSAAYRATLFLTHLTWFLTLRTWLAMIPAQAASTQRQEFKTPRVQNAKSSVRRMLS